VFAWFPPRLGVTKDFLLQSDLKCKTLYWRLLQKPILEWVHTPFKALPPFKMSNIECKLFPQPHPKHKWEFFKMPTPGPVTTADQLEQVFFYHRPQGDQHILWKFTCPNYKPIFTLFGRLYFIHRTVDKPCCCYLEGCTSSIGQCTRHVATIGGLTFIASPLGYTKPRR